MSESSESREFRESRMHGYLLMKADEKWDIYDENR